MTKNTKKMLLSSVLFASIIIFSPYFSYAEQKIMKSDEVKDEDKAATLGIMDTLKKGVDAIKDLKNLDVGSSISSLSSQAGNAAKDKVIELSSKAKDLVVAVKNNAPWGDIMKKTAKTGLHGLGGCAKGTLFSLPAALMVGIPSMGIGTALDLGGACVIGAANAAGPKAIGLIVDSLKTTADLVKMDNEIKTNQADIQILLQAIQDATEMLYENESNKAFDPDGSVKKSVDRGIANTKTKISEIQRYIDTLKTDYAEAQKAFKDKKL